MTPESSELVVLESYGEILNVSEICMGFSTSVALVVNANIRTIAHRTSSAILVLNSIPERLQQCSDMFTEH